MHANDNYSLLKEWTNDDDSFSTYTYWSIPDNTQTTNSAGIRILLYDDKKNETIKEITPFSIYSNNINASIKPVLSTYKVGKTMEYNISNTSDHVIESIEVEICLGSYCDNIARFYDKAGITLQSKYQWEIPQGNEYVSQQQYLQLNIRDIRGNTKQIISDTFVIEPDTELPAPFNESITIFNEELPFPADASETRQEIETLFVKLDSNNVAHAIVSHKYSYNIDSPIYKEHIHTYFDKKYYITYSKNTNTISEKILLCDKNFRVVDFELVSNIPHVVLEKMDHCSWWDYGFKQYYYQRKTTFYLDIFCNIS